MPVPADPCVYLSAELQRLDLLLHREILRLRAIYQLSLDEFRGLYISDEQVNQLIDRSLNYEGATALTAELTQQAEALRIANEQQCGEDLPWSRLAAEFSLSPTEQDILLLAVAPEIQLKYETLYAYLNNDVTRKWPTCDLALRLFSSDLEHAISVRRCLMPDAALFNSGLLQWQPSTTERPSWLASGFFVSPAVLHFLSDICALDSRLTSFVEQRRPAVEWEQVLISSDQRVALRRMVDLFASRLANQPMPLAIFAGRDGAGRRLAAEAVCGELGVALLCVDLEALRASSENIAKLLPAIQSQQRLQNAALYLEKCEALFDKEGKPLPDGRRLIKFFMQSNRPVFMACEPNTRWRELVSGQRVAYFPFADPDYSTRLQLWERALAQVDASVNGIELNALADRFVLTPGQIAAATVAAVDGQFLTADPVANPPVTAADRPLLSSASLFAAARAQSDQGLGNLAVKVMLIHTWEDLILPRVTAQRVREVAAAIKYRHVVYSDWGFAERISSGQGLKALFAGASGTGKTMTAGVIASELGLDLYKIDLSAIVSKYIGETEKNLDSIFRAAHSSNAILFFDEADALFGKRSEVKDAHDRYANIEVAYLLQKIEEYDGVVILASNLSKNIDDAFARRMHYVVEFPLPDENHREQLWRGMFPPQVPLGQDVDFQFIAKQFSITGGDIRNVALDAAFLAAQDGQVVTMKQLIQALARQMMKQGRIPSPIDFKQYHALIGQQD
jgi:ATPase family associated with various cellular activities (AAA)